MPGTAKAVGSRLMVETASSVDLQMPRLRGDCRSSWQLGYSYPSVGPRPVLAVEVLGEWLGELVDAGSGVVALATGDQTGKVRLPFAKEEIASGAVTEADGYQPVAKAAVEASLSPC